jgi:predicted nucleotidyltransferase
MDILINRGLNEETKGIYLYGSYAQGEAEPESDIDVLVITDKTTKQINSNNYEILLVSEENFSKNLSRNLMYLSILKEAVVILNKELIDKYKSQKLKIDLRENINDIKRMIKINESIIQDYREYGLNVPDGTIYSVVLRARELYLIKCLTSKKNYSKKTFVEAVSDKVYSAYLRIKRDEKEVNNISPDEALPVILLSKKWLKELKE